MKAKQLFQETEKGFEGTGVWACGTCGTVWGDRNSSHHGGPDAAAEKCCGPTYCECGKENPKHYTSCLDCQAKKRAEKTAKQIANAAKVDAWDSWVMDPKDGGDQDGYFESLEALLEWYEDEGEAPPEFAFLTTPVPFAVGIEGCIQDALEDQHEDAGESLEGEEEIIKLVNEWAARQTLETYMVDYSRVIKVPAPNPLESSPLGDRGSRGQG